MSFKIKHRTYISSPNDHVNTGLTTVILEFGVGVVCMFFAISDWGNGKTIMFWPFIILASICFLLVLYALIEALYLKYAVEDKQTRSKAE